MIPNYWSPGRGKFNIGNYYCQDFLNNPNCNFDGGDCCGACINTDQCSDCVCHEGGAPAIDTSCNHLFPYYQTPNAERKEFINISKVVHYIFDIQ